VIPRVCAALKPDRSPRWVKLRSIQREQMYCGIPLKADVAQRSRHFAFVPKTDVVRRGAVGPLNPRNQTSRCLTARVRNGPQTASRASAAAAAPGRVAPDRRARRQGRSGRSDGLTPKGTRSPSVFQTDRQLPQVPGSHRSFRKSDSPSGARRQSNRSVQDGKTPDVAGWSKLPPRE
jgi:hypothetical protein